MHRGDRASMNYWLRMRVAAQGLTVAAVVAGSYFYGWSATSKEKNKATTEQRMKLDNDKERERFDQRMREAEEMHRQDEALKAHVPPSSADLKATPPPVSLRSEPPASLTPSKSWTSWIWGGGGRGSGGSSDGEKKV
ncbi:hypothetical protein SISNIDRAFT_457338 [Sistotremastrum niveocremeum HHB9708]|uniref:HIG1 domain-containing protein n=1 Tax=Sistotremastrum niveocremeum HHB9708 TaxID=1314777 RepID=A0A164RN76_9AGAM|nr:hypothetical protein SISNIDRAFT_457338 [Sistotremastrum niveocremeum HHB9708]